MSLIIDDTPDVVFLSSFDLFRRYIAKRSLDELITDKRIQPARIEEIVEKNQNEAEELIKDLGQKTLEEYIKLYFSQIVSYHLPTNLVIWRNKSRLWII